MLFKIKTNVILITFMFLIFRVLLDAWYINVIPTVFAHYPELDYSRVRFAESIIFTLILIYLLPKCWNKPSSFYFSALILSVVVPMCVIYAYADYSRQYMYVVMLTVCVMSIFLKLNSFRVPSIKLLSEIIIVLMISSIVVMFIWLLSKGARLTFDLSLLYEERAKLNEEISGVWGYLISWVGKIFIPVFLILALHYKNKIAIVGVLSVQLLYFGLTTHKLFIVIGLFPIIVYFLFKLKNPLRLSFLLVISVLIAMGVLYLITENKWIPALTVQRPIFKPALLNFVYVDYFSGKNLVLLSNSILSRFIEYPYEKNPAFLIGEYFKGSDVTRSNTGFLGTGFAHFGMFGPLIFGILVSLLLKLLDNVSYNLPLWFSISASFGSFISMIIAADFFAALNTHGVLLTLCILWAFNFRYGKKFSSRI